MRSLSPPKELHLMVVLVDHLFWPRSVTSVPYPCLCQMAKVERGEVRRISLPRTWVEKGRSWRLVTPLRDQSLSR